MSETPLLGLPLIEAAQAQKHITHNEALLWLDAAVHLSVISRAVATPPASPADGDRYLVAAGATGVWAGHEGHIAYREAASWRFATPREGWRLWIEDEQHLHIFDGAAWIDIGLTIGELQNLSKLGVNTTADATNRLAVKSAALLFDNEGAGVQAKINKNAVADTASLLYQTNYSGRAELGLAGDNDFRLKVSANGSAWNDAIVVDRTTGAVSLPNTGSLGVSDGDKGDITVSAGASTWTIDNAVVSNAKLANVATATIKGRVTAATGSPEDLTGTQATTLLNTFTSALKGLAPASGGGTANFLRADGTWVAPPGGGGGEANTASNVGVGGVGVFKQKTGVDLEFKKINAGSSKVTITDDTGNNEVDIDVNQANLALGSIGGTVSLTTQATGTLQAAQEPAHTGDVTNSAGSLALTIANDAVTNAKLANVATATIKGRVTAATGDPEDLTGTQATTLLDTFTSALKGLAPSSGGGSTNFLRADGSWAAPSGGGGVSDGDKGDITVSGSGTVWTVDNSAVTSAKLGGDVTTAGKALLTAAGVNEQLDILNGWGRALATSLIMP